jgi:hypothetical protein
MSTFWRINEWSQLMSIAGTMRKTVIAFLVAALGLFPTSQFLLNAQSQGDDAKPTRKSLPAPETVDQYFRECSPGSTGKHDCAVIERIYSLRLKQLGEAPLISGTDSHTSDIYRIAVVIPVAKVTAKVARIQLENDGSIILIATVADQNGNAASSKKYVLLGQKSEHLRAMLSWNVFSLIDSLDTSKEEHSIRPIRDEGYYLLEGLHDGRYHVLHRSLGSADEFSIGIYRYLDELGIWSGLSP